MVSDTDEASVPPELAADDGPSRRLLIGTALFGVIAVLAVLFGILKYAQRQANSQPVAVVDVAAPQSGSPACESMSKAYPAELAGNWKRAPLRDPAPVAAAAWRRGDDTVVVRCGVERPSEFAVGTSVEQINGVQWFRVGDPSIATSTWYAVDRGTYIAVTMADGSGSEPLTGLSNAIAATLPPVKLDPAPAH